MPARIDIDHEKIAEFCRRHHIRRLSLFGSVLRGDFTPESDVDVLVEFEPGHVPGLGIVQMQDELAALFGREVDLVSRGGLRNPFRRHEILTTRRVICGTGIPSADQAAPPPEGAEGRPQGERHRRSARDVGHLWDMLSTAKEAGAFTSGVTYERYLEDRMLQTATEQVFVEIGRAAERVSPEFRRAHPEIPWAGLIAEQHDLVERYDEVNLRHVWRLVTERLPALIAALGPLVPPAPEDE